MRLWERVRLLAPHVDAHRPLFIADAVLTHGIARVMTAASQEPRVMRAVTGFNTVATALRVLALLNNRVPFALLHPKWSETQTQRARAAAGVGNARGDDVAAVMFTSGSTATPKPVAHNIDSLLHSAVNANARVPFGAGDRWLLSLPICHVGGFMIVLRAVVGGGAVLVPAAAVALRDALIAKMPTHLSLVPTQLMRLLNDVDALVALRQCKEILVGGAPVAGALLKRAADLGVVLRQTWGMTETAAQVCTSARGAADTCGSPVYGMAVRVPAAAGEAGPLLVRGDALCMGILDATDPNVIAACTGADGWFDSLDLARLEADRVVVVGRRDRQFTSGGENVHPDAVAQVLSDADVSVWVVAVDDAEFGQRAFAFFDSLMDDDVVQQRLVTRAHDALANFMRPVAALRVPASLLPKPSVATLTKLAAQHMTALGAAPRETIH